MEEVDHDYALRKLLSLVGQEQGDEHGPFYDYPLSMSVSY